MGRPLVIAAQDETASELVLVSLIAIATVSALVLGIAVTPMEEFLQNSWTALSFL